MDSFEMEKLWNYESEFDNFQLFNTLSNTALYQPLIEFDQIQATQQTESIDFMTVFAGGQQCRNSLRLLSTEPQVAHSGHEEEELNYFCMYSKNEHTNEKKFTLVPFDEKDNGLARIDLALDQPSKVIVINKKMMVGVEKKCITLYRIHNHNLMLKDFDSVGMGNKFILVELQHVCYKGTDYLLLFGNQKEDVKPYFKCLVYQLSGQKLKFIKKANLFQRQFYKPIILFDTYPTKQFASEQFCLILGGFSDYEQENFNFSGLQVHLHLLLLDCLQYPLKSTNQILFKKKHTITSGKALKIGSDISRDQFWLLFCTEYQTITKMDLSFGQHDDEFKVQSMEFDTKTLKIRDESSGEFESIYYSENSLYLLRVPFSYVESKNQIPYRIYWCNKSMQKVCSRPLQQILKVFSNS